MNEDEYRKAMNSVVFSADFQQRTVARLEQQQGKEIIMLKHSKRTAKTMLVAACLALLLIGTAAAAAYLLSAGEIAAFAGDETLSAAFSGDDAIIMDETQVSGEYIYRLAGLVSGKGISDFWNEAESDQTYAIVSKARVDGKPIEEADFSTIVTPLVSGYMPWHLNLWTLSGGAHAFIQNGVLYYIHQFDSVEMFADHTVYLAIYEGFSPNSETFAFAEDGTISFQPDYTAPHALFTIPLDPAKADPEAVKKFLVENDLDSLYE